MPSFINTPLPSIVTAVTNGGATEFVIATSGPVNLDSPEQLVLISFAVDITNSSSGVTIALKLERGTAAGGTGITKGGTWGPFTLVASNRANFGGEAYDLPGASGGAQYVLTGTVASNSGTFTVNTAMLSVQVQSAS